MKSTLNPKQKTSRACTIQRYLFLVFAQLIISAILSGCTPHPNDPVLDQIEAVAAKQVDFDQLPWSIQLVLGDDPATYLLDYTGADTPLFFWGLNARAQPQDSFMYVLFAQKSPQDSARMTMIMSIQEDLAQTGAVLRNSQAQKGYHFRWHRPKIHVESDPGLPFFLQIDRWDTTLQVATGRASGLLAGYPVGDTVWVKECYFKTKIRPFASMETRLFWEEKDPADRK